MSPLLHRPLDEEKLQRTTEWMMCMDARACGLHWATLPWRAGVVLVRRAFLCFHWRLAVAHEPRAQKEKEKKNLYNSNFHFFYRISFSAASVSLFPPALGGSACLAQKEKEKNCINSFPFLLSRYWSLLFSYLVSTEVRKSGDPSSELAASHRPWHEQSCCQSSWRCARPAPALKLCGRPWSHQTPCIRCSEGELCWGWGLRAGRPGASDARPTLCDGAWGFRPTLMASRSACVWLQCPARETGPGCVMQGPWPGPFALRAKDQVRKIHQRGYATCAWLAIKASLALIAILKQSGYPLCTALLPLLLGKRKRLWQGSCHSGQVSQQSDTALTCSTTGIWALVRTFVLPPWWCFCRCAMDPLWWRSLRRWPAFGDLSAGLGALESIYLKSKTCVGKPAQH